MDDRSKNKKHRCKGEYLGTLHWFMTEIIIRSKWQKNVWTFLLCKLSVGHSKDLALGMFHYWRLHSKRGEDRGNDKLREWISDNVVKKAETFVDIINGIPLSERESFIFSSSWSLSTSPCTQMDWLSSQQKNVVAEIGWVTDVLDKSGSTDSPCKGF